MGTIILEGEPPFELATQKSPTAIIEGKTIVPDSACLRGGRAPFHG